MSIEFVLTALVVVLVPGTGVVYTVSTALARGARPGFVAAIGCTLGIVPHLVAAALGLSAILHLGSLVFRVLRLAGVAYLLYLAWGMWSQPGVLEGDAANDDSGWFTIVRRGVLLNILNPKLTLFFFAFLPQFLNVGTESALAEMSVLSAVFMAMTLIVFSLYGLMASGVRRFIKNQPTMLRAIQKSFAGIFALFAIRLAVAVDE